MSIIFPWPRYPRLVDGNQTLEYHFDVKRGQKIDYSNNHPSLVGLRTWMVACPISFNHFSLLPKLEITAKRCRISSRKWWEWIGGRIVSLIGFTSQISSHLLLIIFPLLRQFELCWEGVDAADAICFFTQTQTKPDLRLNSSLRSVVQRMFNQTG